ncbi:MAG: hypothetical protein ABI675_14660 [Chitinophagaceae bacterium]
MCGKVAISKEHVPPACLFPEEKDIKTSIFRNNLITVPSCDLHNSKKSKDDEFLMGCLAGIVGNNVIGFFHNITKVKRALDRKGEDFIHVLMKDAKRESIKNFKGDIFPVLVGRPDFDRLRSCFLHIAYGLYYHKFGRAFNGECHIIMDFLTYDNEESEKYKLLCRKRFEMEPNKPKNEGANPEIFRYEFIEPDEFGLIALRITFYEGTNVLIAFQEANGKKPFNLITELISSGVKTMVTFKDGTEFPFN